VDAGAASRLTKFVGPVLLACVIAANTQQCLNHWGIPLLAGSNIFHVDHFFLNKSQASRLCYGSAQPAF